VIESINSTIKPVFRDNATLYINQPELLDSFSRIKSILVISNQLGKKYSFCTILDEVKLQEDPNMLEIDKDLVGPLLEGDIVSILSFGVPQAETIFLTLPISSYIPEGDWGFLLKDQFKGQILDIGSEFIFTYPSSKPTIITSYLRSSIPISPIRITENTRVITKKTSIEDLAQIRSESIIERGNRVHEYLEQVSMKSFQLIGMIKTGKANSAITDFKFTANPNTILSGVRTIFNSWKEMNFMKDLIGDDFIAGMDYLMQAGNEPKIIVEISIFCQKDEGKLTLSVYTVPEINARDTLNEIASDINNLAVSVRNTFRVIDTNCPNDGSPLDLTQVEQNGWIKCNNCKEMIEIPLKYRLH